MEQITREEMIGLLEGLYNKLMDVTECLECCGRMGPECCGSPEPRVPDDVLQLVDKARQYAAALQAAEPAMVIDVGRGVHGTPAYEKLFFNESLENGRHELFTLPCPPAKAQVPEGWDIDYGELGEIVVSAPDGELEILYPDEAMMELRLLYAMLTASPAPEHVGDGNEIVEVPFHMLALGTRFRYSSILDSEYVKISATQVARWQDDMVICGWAGQGVYSFDEKDGTDTKVLVAVPTGLRQQEEAAPVVQHRYPCGCVTCICEDGEQCQGCGATTCDDCRGPSCGCTQQEEGDQ